LNHFTQYENDRFMSTEKDFPFDDFQHSASQGGLNLDSLTWGSLFTNLDS
jgi:hypothetical protein